MRVKFGMEAIENTEETCIIVVEVKRGDDTDQMGILVDKVSEVLDTNGGNIEDAPSFVPGFDANFIMGMAKTKDSVKILLDIDSVLSGHEIVEVTGIAAAQA